ncbi:MAG: type II secretion system protein GspJ [Candidatus Binatia bacterium]
MTARDRRGFTLLEITVTLGILSIVLAIVYGVFSQTIGSKELAERRADEDAGARGALARIARDLESARPVTSMVPAAPPAAAAGPTPSTRSTFIPERGLFLARVRTEGGVALDDLAFTTFLRRPTATAFAASDLGIVHYFVGAFSPQSGLALYRETVLSLTGDNFDPDQPNAAASTMILPGVTELDFRFFDGSDWVDGWDSTDSRNFAPAPRAVEIAIGIVDREGNAERYVTSVDLPIVRTLKNPKLVGRPTPPP